MEPSGGTGKREKVTTVFVLAQWTRGPSKVKGLGECFFKALVRRNQCHIRCAWKDWLLTCQGDVRGLVTSRGPQFRVEESQIRDPTFIEFLR